MKAETIIPVFIIILAASNIVMNLIAAPIVFMKTFYRSPKKPRVRACTGNADEAQLRMFREGKTWAEQYKERTVNLEITNDDLRLYGEYIDLGFDKCAVILQGRTESLIYSYYFADAYVKTRHNILVVDVRAHGQSDGVYQTLGVRESDDLIVWLKLLNSMFHISDFTLHGICVGGVTAVFTYVKMKQAGVNWIKRIVTDGLYISHYEMYKRNFRRYYQPAFPALHLTFLIAYVLTGVRLFSQTPIRYMKDIDIPILFIWSVQDIFCVRAKSEALYKACASPDKACRFFPEGRHSHVRSSREVEYDTVVTEFIRKYD